MNHFPILAVIIGNTLVLALGAIITHLITRAARRTGSRDLTYLGYGFGLVTLSMVFGGGIHALVGDVVIGAAARSILTSMGFTLILYSLWIQKQPRVRSVRDPEHDL